MKFTSTDIEIIRAILAADEVQMYELHEKYFLSPAQILDSLDKLVSIGVVARLGFSLRATAATRNWVVLHRYDLFKNREKPWLRKFSRWPEPIPDSNDDEAEWSSRTLARNYFLRRVNV